MKQGFARSAGCNKEMLSLRDDNSVGKLFTLARIPVTTWQRNALSGFFLRTRKTVSRSSRYLVK